jgi:hypothetical protein
LGKKGFVVVVVVVVVVSIPQPYTMEGEINLSATAKRKSVCSFLV